MWGFLVVLAGCGGDVSLNGEPGGPRAPTEAPEAVGGFDVEGAEPPEDVGPNFEKPKAVPTWRAEVPDGTDVTISDRFFAPGRIHEFHLSLPAGSATKLAERDWVSATFSAEEEDYPVKVRLKGTTSFRDLTGKAAFRIDFAEEDPTARFHALKRLTLNNMMQDSSMLHEHVAYWLYRHRGVPAPRHTFARLWVDGTYFGLYGVVETADEQFVNRVFPEDNNGNLYEANVSDFYTWKTDHFELEETDDILPAYEDLYEVIAKIDAASVEDYTRVLGEIFDLDLLMRMWAIELVTTNVDGYAMFANNYLLYHGEEKWYMLPWGHDQCLEWYRDVDDFSEIEGRLLLRCREAPECDAMLNQAMLDLVDDWETSEMLAFTEAATALVDPLCVADPRAEKVCDTEHVARFVRDRPATVRERVSP